MAGSDKRLLRLISQEGGNKPETLVPLSLPESSYGLSRSPYGRSNTSDTEGSLTDAVSVKTLSYLISALNASFKPDFDFSSAKSSEFFREPLIDVVMSTVNSQLLANTGEFCNVTANQFWTVVDDEINIQGKYFV